MSKLYNYRVYTAIADESVKCLKEAEIVLSELKNISNVLKMRKILYQIQITWI